MTDSHRRHGQNGHEILDVPPIRNERRYCQDDHTHNTHDRKCDAELEPLQHLWHLDEEVGEFSFLGRRTPCHIDFEHVGQQGLRDVQGEAAEEDGEHEDPFEVFDQGAEEGAIADAVAHHCESDVSKTVEYDDNRKPGTAVSMKSSKGYGIVSGIDLPNFPRVDVVLIEVSVKPAYSEVVGSCHDPGGTDSIVSADVRDNRDFARKSDVAEQEATEKLGERTPCEPEADWMEKQLIASISVFLPSSKFIVDSE